MTVIFGIILSGYCLLVMSLLWGWFRMRMRKIQGLAKYQAGISVVVACRNEEHNAAELIHNLSSIHYPSGKFEVILVDDHSSDGTLETLKALILPFPNFSIGSLMDQHYGKKQAIQEGISKSQFDIIVTTDADCRVPADWLSYISLFFEGEELKMLIGGVRMERGTTIFSRLQTMEFCSLIGSAAAACGFGHPIMSNGANLAFRKEAFYTVGGYDGNLHIASGDDEFLMRKIRSRYPQGIVFMNFSESAVSLKPLKSMKDFMNQRLRWAGKWKHNSDPWTKMLAVFIVIAQVAYLALIIQSFHIANAWVLSVFFKMMLEAVLIVNVFRFFRLKFDPPAFVFLQLIYPVYAIVIGIFSLFGSYHWKNRNYK